tara:strand:- start:1245 stop:1589 length:345 start_codon:yes stop_codon:yes gene_type:complete
MNIILKIEEYLPDRNAVVVKLCRLNSHKPIDDFGAKVVDCDGLDLIDTESFIESLISRMSYRINEQDNQSEILEENKPESVIGDLDIQSLVGKVIGGAVTSRKIRHLRMRRVNL